MKTFKNHLKAVRYIYENFIGQNRDNIIDAIYKHSIVKCKFNLDSPNGIILVVDKYNLLD